MPNFTLTITQAGSTQEITADSRISLLEVMRNNHLPVRKACRNGACGICRCRLTLGHINYFLRKPFALWETEINDGYILPCIAYAESDIHLDDITLENKQQR